MGSTNGKFIVGSNTAVSKLKYKVINGIEDFDKCSCIVVKTLNPDFYLLFSSIKLIVTEAGSALSHLAIVAREHNIPVFLAENITERIPKEGTLSINNNEIQVD